MKSILYSLIIFFVIIINSIAFSQFHFGIKHSAKDISAQRELFRNANVEHAISSSGWKILFDTAGKILNKEYTDNIDVFEFYEYDSVGNLIFVKESWFDNPTKLIYDENRNLIRYTSDEIDEKYFYNEADKLINSEIVDQLVEAHPLESIIYENDLIIEKKWKCWDMGNMAPFTYSKIKYAYDQDKRVISIIEIFGNCKNDVEEVSLKTTIEYNERNLPVKYITKSNLGEKDVSTISYKYFK